MKELGGSLWISATFLMVAFARKVFKEMKEKGDFILSSNCMRHIQILVSFLEAIDRSEKYVKDEAECPNLDDLSDYNAYRVLTGSVDTADKEQEVITICQRVLDGTPPSDTEIDTCLTFLGTLCRGLEKVQIDPCLRHEISQWFEL